MDLEVATELKALNAKLDALLQRQAHEAEPRKPGYTVKAVAKILHVDRKTVHRWINQGKIRKSRGRIPHSELTPYLS